MKLTDKNRRIGDGCGCCKKREPTPEEVAQRLLDSLKRTQKTARTWLKFKKRIRPVGRKTDIVDVIQNHDDEEYLGHIAFYPKWRGFVFVPKDGTYFSKGCLAEITFKINEMEHERKDERKEPKKQLDVSKWQENMREQQRIYENRRKRGI